MATDLKPVHINLSITPEPVRRRTWDGITDETTLHQIITPLLRAAEHSGHCLSLRDLTKVVLECLGDRYTSEIQRCMQAIRSSHANHSKGTQKEMEEYLERVRPVLELLGIDGSQASAEGGPPMIVPVSLLPQLEVLYLSLTAWLSEHKDQVIKEPVFAGILAGGLTVAGNAGGGR